MIEIEGAATGLFPDNHNGREMRAAASRIAPGEGTAPTGAAKARATRVAGIFHLAAACGNFREPAVGPAALGPARAA